MLAGEGKAPCSCEKRQKTLWLAPGDGDQAGACPSQGTLQPWWVPRAVLLSTVWSTVKVVFLALENFSSVDPSKPSSAYDVLI